MRLIPLIILTFSAALGYALESGESFHHPEIEEVARKVSGQLEELRKTQQIPGMTYSVFTAEDMLFSGGLGHANTKHSEHADPDDSIFRIASVSKLFVQLATAKMIEDGHLSFDQKIMDIKGVAFIDKILKIEASRPERLKRWRMIKVKHLLGHLAGISKDNPGITMDNLNELMFMNNEALNDYSYASMDLFMNNLDKIEFLYDKPGTFRYSNLGMNMLARIVEGVNPKKLKYKDYLKKHVFRPLGLRHTFVDVDWGHIEYMVDDHGSRGSHISGEGRTKMKPAVYAGSYDGSIGIAISSNDLGRFGMEMSKVISYQPNRLLNDPKVISTLFKSVTLNSNKPQFMRSRAYGPTWFTRPKPDGSLSFWMGHTGTTFGSRALLYVSPKEGYGIAMLWNANDASREKYAQIVIDEMSKSAFKAPRLNSRARRLFDETENFLKTADTVPRESNVSHDPYPRSQLEKFVGNYYISGIGVQTVAIQEDGHIYLEMWGKKHLLEVEDVEAGKFRFLENVGLLFRKEPLRFTFDKTGNVTGFFGAWVKYFSKID